MDQTPAGDDALDRALVQRWLNGDRDAADGLVRRYERRLFTLALRMLGNVQDAEDVTQTVFCNAFLAMRSYNPKFRFFSWIYRMTINESLNQMKRRRPTVVLDDDSALPSADVAADDALAAEDAVNKALHALKPHDRSIVVLRHFMSLSYEEIAGVLKVPVRTVKSRLFTARERLRLTLLAHQA